MDLDILARIKKTAIQALVSDDVLMDRLILKGGNALDLIHKISERASFDLDFSIVDSFEDSELDNMENKIRQLLVIAFKEIEYQAFDVSFKKRPKAIKPELDSFWGGYLIEFKVIHFERLNELKTDMDAIRRNALPVGHRNSTKLRIEISRFEYCPLVEQAEVDGYMINVYSPVLIAIEKLRAICQQMNEYKHIVPSVTPTPRARDFFDIFTIFAACNIDIQKDIDPELIESVFAAKKVPLHYLQNIEQYRQFHSQDFVSVKDVVKPNIQLRGFDFYFDYVIALCEELNARGII